MAGSRGPIPKRSEERRRRNEPSIELTKVNLAESVKGEVQVPEADEAWHPVARHWYESLAKSGQAVFYEPSDWATAHLLAESMSRDLKPQVVGIHPETGEAVMAKIPLKGASLSAYLKGFSALMVTEGDRRRMSIELERERGKAEAEEAARAAGVPAIADRRAARAAGRA